MTHPVFDQPLDARLVDGEIVITGPDGFNGSLTLEAAKASAENLARAVGAGASQTEVYQKPLG